jgi:hypothetical protein
VGWVGRDQDWEFFSWGRGVFEFCRILCGGNLIVLGFIFNMFFNVF